MLTAAQSVLAPGQQQQVWEHVHAGLQPDMMVFSQQSGAQSDKSPQNMLGRRQQTHWVALTQGQKLSLTPEDASLQPAP